MKCASEFIMLTVLVLFAQFSLASTMEEQRNIAVSLSGLIESSQDVIGIHVLSAKIDYGSTERRYGCGVIYGAGTFDLEDELERPVELGRNPIDPVDSRVRESMFFATLGPALDVGHDYVVFVNPDYGLKRVRTLAYDFESSVDRELAERFCNDSFPVTALLYRYDWLEISNAVVNGIFHRVISIPVSMKLGTTPIKVYVRDDKGRMREMNSSEVDSPRALVGHKAKYIRFNDFVRLYVDIRNPRSY